MSQEKTMASGQVRNESAINPIREGRNEATDGSDFGSPHLPEPIAVVLESLANRIREQVRRTSFLEYLPFLDDAFQERAVAEVRTALPQPLVSEMVTWTEFERVQHDLDRGAGGSIPKPKQYEYGYRGLIRCGRCHAVVTAEEKRKSNGRRYLYYHCCRKNRVYGYCPEASIERAELEHDFATFLGTLALPDSIASLLLEVAGRLEKTTADESKSCEERLSESIARIEARLRQLRALCADGVIGVGELAEDREALLVEKRRLEDELSRARRPLQLIEPLQRSISFVEQAVFAFDKGNAKQRERITRAVSSNILLKDKKPLIEAKKLFAMFRDLKAIPRMWARRESNSHALASTPPWRGASIVPMVGVEPTCSCERRILSPVCLPVPSHRRSFCPHSITIFLFSSM